MCQMNSQHTAGWELSRFATNTQYRIPGIVSKLFKHFTQEYPTDTVFTYSRWGTGTNNVYSSPVQIPGTKWYSIVPGGLHVLALKA